MILTAGDIKRPKFFWWSRGASSWRADGKLTGLVHLYRPSSKGLTVCGVAPPYSTIRERLPGTWKDLEICEKCLTRAREIEKKESA
jgi:hypothetical protein